MATRAATAPIGGLQLSSVRYDDEGDDDGAYSDQDGVTSNGMPSPGSAVQFEPMVDARGKTTYKCPECETTIATLSLMQMHYKKHLNTNGKVKRTISQVEHLPLRPPKGLPAVCAHHRPDGARMPALNRIGSTPLLVRACCRRRRRNRPRAPRPQGRAAGARASPAAVRHICRRRTGSSSRHVSIGACGRACFGSRQLTTPCVITSRGTHQLFWSRTPKLSVVPKDRTKFETYVRKTAAVVRATSPGQPRCCLARGQSLTEVLDRTPPPVRPAHPAAAGRVGRTRGAAVAPVPTAPAERDVGRELRRLGAVQPGPFDGPATREAVLLLLAARQLY